MQAKALNKSHFSQEDIQTANNTWKVAKQHCRQEDANQTHSEVAYHLREDGHHQQDRREQGLARMQRQWNSHSFMAGGNVQQCRHFGKQSGSSLKGEMLG